MWIVSFENGDFMFRRDLEKVIRRLAGKFPVLSITGPRQSGKTTLVREIFKNYNYVLLAGLFPKLKKFRI